MAGIRAAAEKLRTIDEPALAKLVDSTLTPAHRALLGRAWESGVNLPIKMPKTFRDLIKKKAKAGGENITHIVDDGFARFLAGEFAVLTPERKAWGTKEETVVLNTSPDSGLQANTSAKCRDLRESGAHPGLYVSTVAAAILYEHYGLGPYADDAETGTAG
ncbi:hypothetical protein [Streptomyces sp. NPDC060366]|uniref:hypothetical protein n=1 Tax=Streptomyces sp. NPDC060366 TaxID=3347105 RepID=UPI003659AB0E